MTETMSRRKRLAFLILGWGLVVLGVVGIFLPFLQGLLFLLIGLILLARVQPWARALVVRTRRRYPAVNRAHSFAERKTDALVARFRGRRIR